MIRIGENSIYYHPIHMDSKPRFIEEDELPMFLSDEVGLDKSVTFDRLFKLIMIHATLFNKIYAYGTLGNYTIGQYSEEFYKTGVKDDGDEDPDSIDYLEVYWGSEYWNFKEGKEISLYPAFHGINENFTDEHQKEPCRMNIGLDFTPINQLRKYKVKLNKHVQFNDWVEQGKTLEEKYPLLMEGDHDFSLFDLFQAILHEISFYGTPENRDAKAAELDATVERIKSGEEKTYEMKKENGKYNFYDTETGELHDSFPDDEDDEIDEDDSCGCGSNCECDD